VTPGARDEVGRREVRARPLAAADMGVARALLLGGFGVSPHAERVLELLQLAGRRQDPESRGLVAESESRVVGVALFGEIAGTAGGARIHLLRADCAGEGRAEEIRARLIDEVVERLSAAGVRYICAELPDDPWFLAMRRSLARAGFDEEARLNDLFFDGVALVFLRRDLRPRDAAGRP
jgi:hypothetical protein